MADIILNPNKSSGGGAVRSVHFLPFVKLADNKAVGMSKDDSSNDATGTLYPNSLNTTLTSQTQITTVFGTEPASYFPTDDDQYDVNESKLKVAEKFFTKYKKLVALVYSSFTSTPRILTTAQATLYGVYKVEWLSATRFAMLFLDQSSVQNLRLVCGEIGTDGLVTWGTAATVKTYTDVTHTNNGHMGMSLTDTDKLLIFYTNKVTTNYWLKARVAVITTTSIALQSESADIVNFGATALGYQPSVKIRGSAGAGAIAIISAAASGTTVQNNVTVLSHDNANAISGTGATLQTPTAAPVTRALFSYATDRIAIYTKDSGSNHIKARLYSVSGTTVTALGAAAVDITQSAQTNHYLPADGHLATVNFGSSILGVIYGFNDPSNWRCSTISVASDVLTLLDDASSTVSQFNVSSDTYAKVITKGDNTGLIYGKQNIGGDRLVTHVVSYAGGRAVVTTSLTVNLDLGTVNYLTGVYPSAAKTLFLESNLNYNQTVKYQIGAGDSVIQILDVSNNVLGTITETNDGAGQTKLKTLNLTNAALFANGRMLLKLKNTSGQARIIKISTVYAEVE